MISRRNFLATCAALGLSALAACSDDGGQTPLDNDASSQRQASSETGIGSVIVIGAGAAGMSVGHLLTQRNVDFEILEAAPNYGGRIKTTHDFVDFPIPLGGEWIHAPASILQRIVNDASVEVETHTVGYSDADTGITATDGEMVTNGQGDWEDLKFVDGTWLTFFETYIVPGIADRITTDAIVTAIEIEDESVTVTDASGTVRTADAVVVTVPLQILRDGDITFTPPLSDRKTEALAEAQIWGGLKVFVEFSERFYPTAFDIAGTNDETGQKLWYDAAHGQDSQHHVLGLFTVGVQSEPYRGLSDAELAGVVLEELDGFFDGAASPSYVQHIVQDWNAEPFIRQAYLGDEADWRPIPIIREPIDGLVFFAGDAYTNGQDWSSVHVAAQSAREAVNALLS